MPDTPLKRLLQNQDLLYSNLAAEYSGFGHYYGHFVMWSSSATSNDGDSPWDVRAAF
jgi:hypothetical protein